MLTGKLVRVRYARARVIPRYLDPSDPTWLEVAERLLEVFRARDGRPRSCLEEDLRETVGNDPLQIVHQGLAKLLEDRCEFEVVSGHPPEQIREAVFRAATAHRVRESESGSAREWERESAGAQERREEGQPPSHSPTLP